MKPSSDVDTCSEHGCFRELPKQTSAQPLIPLHLRTCAVNSASDHFLILSQCPGTVLFLLQGCPEGTMKIPEDSTLVFPAFSGFETN